MPLWLLASIWNKTHYSRGIVLLRPVGSARIGLLVRLWRRVAGATYRAVRNVKGPHGFSSRNFLPVSQRPGESSLPNY